MSGHSQTRGHRRARVAQSWTFSSKFMVGGHRYQGYRAHLVHPIFRILMNSTATPRDHKMPNHAKKYCHQCKKLECTVIILGITIAPEKVSRSQLSRGAIKVVHNDDNISSWEVRFLLRNQWFPQVFDIYLCYFSDVWKNHSIWKNGVGNWKKSNVRSSYLV